MFLQRNRIRIVVNLTSGAMYTIIEWNDRVKGKTTT